MQQPPSLQEIRARRKPIQNVNVLHQESLSVLEVFAVWFTDRIGSMGFFGFLSIWTAGWLIWNVYAPASYRFDPYPAFVLWLFISNTMQLLFLPLIMVGQNLQSRHSEVRAESDFELSLKAEEDIEVILQHLEYQNDLLLKFFEENSKEKTPRKASKK